jgi:hypothetical protein
MHLKPMIEISDREHVKKFKRSLPKQTADAHEVELAKKREALQIDINNFYDQAKTLCPGIDFEEIKCEAAPLEPIQIENEDPGEVHDEPDNPFSLSQNEVEHVRLPLPSSFPSPVHPSILAMREKEIQLRIGQADDSLEGMRSAIGHKSYLYRSNVRLAEGKRQRTRGYGAVKVVDDQLRLHIRIYNHARWSLIRLGADPTLLVRFEKLLPEHTKAITAVYKPNASGQRNKRLSWIWTMKNPGQKGGSNYLDERELFLAPIIDRCHANRLPVVYRVNWLRAKCRWERWREEHILLTAEMDWMIRFFAFKSKECHAWCEGEKSSLGLQAYARRQAEMWRLLGVQAERMFSATRAAGKQPTEG